MRPRVVGRRDARTRALVGRRGAEMVQLGRRPVERAVDRVEGEVEEPGLDGVLEPADRVLRLAARRVLLLGDADTVLDAVPLVVVGPLDERRLVVQVVEAARVVRVARRCRRDLPALRILRSAGVGRVPEVPLTDRRAVVARRLQELRQRLLLQLQPEVRLGELQDRFADPRAERIAPGLDPRARRRAARRDAALVEAHTRLRESVERRRRGVREGLLVLVLPVVHRQEVDARVVDEHEQDVAGSADLGADGADRGGAHGALRR